MHLNRPSDIFILELGLWLNVNHNGVLVTEKETYERRVEALRCLVADLPEDNRTLIRMIMKHLTQYVHSL